MAQLVIAAVGAAIGSYAIPGTILGMSGAAFGWAVGSLVGSAFTPKQKSEGPRIDDLKVGKIGPGQPVPWIQGHPRVPGHVVWSSDKRELATTTEYGKGGGAEVTDYEYEIDMMVMVSSNTIAAVSRIWADGKLIWSLRHDSTAETLSNSENTNRWRRMTVYTGAADQLPDPTMEAAVGVGSTPAMRSRGCVFFEGYGLGPGGNLPNLTFEVCSSATYLPAILWSASNLGMIGVDAATGAVLSTTAVGDGSYPAYAATWAAERHWVADNLGRVLPFDPEALSYGTPVDVAPGDYPTLLSATASPDGSAVYFGESIGAGSARLWKIDTASGSLVDTLTVTGYRHITALVMSDDGAMLYATVEAGDGSGGLARIETAGLTLSSYTAIGAAGAGVPNLIRNGDHLLVASGTRVYEISTAGSINTSFEPSASLAPRGLAVVGDDLFIGFGSSRSLMKYGLPVIFSDLYTYQSTFTMPIGAFGHHLYLAVDGITLYINRVNAVSVGLYAYDTAAGALKAGYTAPTVGAYAAPTQRGKYLTAGIVPGTETVRAVVERLCDRAGMAPAQVDASALDSITRPVRGLAVSQIGGTRATLDTLAAAYFFEAYARGPQLVFVPRGGASMANVPFADLATGAGQADGEPLRLTLANEIELPAMVTVTYANELDDYQDGSESSDRLLSGQRSTSQVALPLALQPGEAKGIAETMVLDAVSSMISASVSLPHAHIERTPTDIITLSGRDGSSYRMRIVKRTWEPARLAFDVVSDDPSVLRASGITDVSYTPSLTVASIPATLSAVWDLPLIIETTDDAPVLYAQGRGVTSPWPAGALMSSSDDVAYTEALRFVASAVLGSSSAAVAACALPTVMDSATVFTVNVGYGQLASTTREALLRDGSVNLLAVRAAGGPVELLQFQTATLVSEGVYTLSNLLRGRRGTEAAAAAGHASGATVGLLTQAGLRRWPLEYSDLAVPRFYKAISAGQRLSAVAASTVTPAGMSLQPFSPVHARGARNGAGDLALSWSRRSRLYTRLLSPLGIDSPLGEASEAYEVDVFSDNTYSTVLRTIAATSASASYSAAQQTTDFGSPQATVYLRIHQLGARIGRGAACSAAV